jgi:MOSC domain-containing protein YiiM
MAEGSVTSIYVSSGSGEPMRSLTEARAIAGKGLEGDRYFGAEVGVALTLIEAEAIEAVEGKTGLKLGMGDPRRNIVTRGIVLNDLLDQEFEVGGVRLRGVRLSEPCEHLASLTDPRIVKGLVHKGGLKCEILSDGMIRVGDPVSAEVLVAG